MIDTKGYLEKFQKGFGFLRDVENNFNLTDEDTYVPAHLIKKYRLDEGAYIQGTAEKSSSKNKNPVLNEIKSINDHQIEDAHKIVSFKDSVSINPDDKFALSLDDRDIIGRCLDLLTPMGKGQRGLIVSPPKAGKTTILQHIAKAIIQNHDYTDIFILLVDELTMLGLTPGDDLFGVVGLDSDE